MSDTRVYHDVYYTDSDPEKAGIFGTRVAVLGSFLNVKEPKRVSKSEKEEPKYSANFEIDADAPLLAAIRAKIVAVASAKWPGKDIGAAIRSGELVVPLTKGDTLADKAIAKGKKREWSRGKVVLSARTQHPFECSVVSGGKIVSLDRDNPTSAAIFKDKFYTGVNVLFEVNLSAYEAVGQNGKPGVTAYLNLVCSTGTGAKLISQGERSAEAFKGYIGQESNEDPTGAAPAAADADW